MSMAPLLGVPGKLKTLLDRLTSARATNLDDIDTTVSSRAPSSTAVSNANLTVARITKLDNLDDLDANTGLAKREFQLLTSGTSWTKPANMIGDVVLVSMVAGGGSGNINATTGKFSGFGGEYISRYPYDVGAGPVTYAIGAGGAGTSGSLGTAGTDTDFGTLTVQGGSGGAAYDSATMVGTQGSTSQSTPYTHNAGTSGPFGLPGGSYDYSDPPGGRGLSFGGTEYGNGSPADSTGTTSAGTAGAILVEWLETI